MVTILVSAETGAVICMRDDTGPVIQWGRAERWPLFVFLQVPEVATVDDANMVLAPPDAALPRLALFDLTGLDLFADGHLGAAVLTVSNLTHRARYAEADV